MDSGASFTTPAADGRSRQLLARGCNSLCGGDSSTMRVLPYHVPLVAERGAGCRVWDADAREYLDLNMAYGPLLFGHCPPHVIRAVTRQISERGSQLGFPTEISIRVAEKLKTLFPAMQRMRFANSGTEAMNLAVRLARTVTGRRKIVVFEGNYHGWSDPLFHRYHAALEELPAGPYGPAIPGTLGMDGAPLDLLVVRSCDLDALHACLDDHPQQVAAVVLEPIMCNSGLIEPGETFLRGLREATLARDVLLVFDEVITGLRVAAGGAQELYRVTPDITVVSKALGGGYPVAACGGSREIMEVIANRSLFHGGVYAGNALVMAAAEAVLDEIIAHRESIYAHLERVGRQLAVGLEAIFCGLDVPHVVAQVGPVVSLFLTKDRVSRLANYREVRTHCDFEGYIRFQHEMQSRGVYFHPNQFETMFLSTAHAESDIAAALQRIAEGAQRCFAP